MAIRLLLAVLLGLCWRTSRVEGVTFSLRGDSISTSGNEVINVTDIGNDNDNALVCQSERPSEEVSLSPNWFVDTDGEFPSADERDGNMRLVPDNYDMLGWNRDRLVDNDNPRIVYLRRQSDTALEGYFTCDIGSDDNTPRGLFILYPLSVTVSVRVISRRDRTYTVTCTATGGRLSSSSLTGPGLPSSGLSLQRGGSNSDRGENTYSRTSDTLSEDVGSVYTCTATNNVSSPETSLELAAAGDPTLEELVPLSPTAVRMTWSHPSDGATVTGYTVHYTRDGGRARRISGLAPSTTSIDITGLTNGRTYTITVEVVATNSLSGESEERTITLRIDPPEGVMVTAVEPASVRVSWQSVENADNYTVTFTQARGDEQQGLCLSATHIASVSVDTTSASIDVGQDVGDDVTDMLRAYTTYFITVVAESDALGTSSSEPAEHTTIQTSAAEVPSSVRARAENSTAILVEWFRIPTCRLVNGLIVKYRVQYTAQPSGRVQSADQTADEPRSGAEISLTGLTPFTTYSIQVAGVNEEGDVGLYSEPITKQTDEDSAVNQNTNTETTTAPIIIGVVISIIGVAVGVPGLIIAAVTVKKHRPVSGGVKAGGVYVSTDANPAYGLSSPHQKHTESESDYETPQYIQPSSAAAPQEAVYEVF